MNQYLFQNCQKIVIFSSNFSHVLLCKRKGENDYDGVFSFIGGKMETTDTSLIDGIQREKEEEIGKECVVNIYPTFNYMIYFQKKDGNHMLLPHYMAVFESGDINLNEEYSEYSWVKIEELASFEPKIPNIDEVVSLFLKNKDLLMAKASVQV